VLYGGSVKSSSAAGLMAKPDVDGALIGGASLDVDEFVKIVELHIAAVNRAVANRVQAFLQHRKEFEGDEEGRKKKR